MNGVVVAADFRPHPLLRNPHLQTIIASQLRPLPSLPLRRERWELPDGDFVDLGWFGPSGADQPLAVLVHGLTGGFESKYLLGTARRLIAAGWSGVILQLRGAGAEPNRLAPNYHQGDTADLLALLQRLRAQSPQAHIATVGWSLGGNIVLKAAGEAGADHLADQVAAASVPFVLAPCAERLRQGFSRIYQRRLLNGLRDGVRRKAAAMSLPAIVDLPAALTAPDFFAFDDAWTAPLNGFLDAADYYARTACGQFLGDIRRPCLIVHSRDDPFMTADMVPSPRELAAGVRLELSERGGHVGFLAASRYGGFDYWLERRLVEGLEANRR